MLIVLILILIYLGVVAINTLMLKLVFIRNIPDLAYYKEEDILTIFFIVWCPITNVIWLVVVPILFLVGRLFNSVKSNMKNYIEWLLK
nr:MAG TPA: hypothetical protein [Crassvirales sp.]